MVEIRLPYGNLSDSERKEWREFYLQEISNNQIKWLNDVYSFLAEWFTECETIMLQTSGSTGEPKRIEMAKSTMLFSARLTCDYFQFRKNEKWLLCLPSEFIGGQMILVRAMEAGAAVWAVEPKIDIKVSGEFHFASMIPMQAEAYLKQDDFHIAKILIGGASVPAKLEENIRSTENTEFYASYGMTETVSHVALRKLNGVGASSYFQPLKNILIGKDDRGCLTIYHRSYSENVIITNDLVDFDDENAFRIRGRVDNIINSGGLKIIPEIIEHKLSETISSRLLVVGIPDEKYGEKAVLLIESAPLDGMSEKLLLNFMEGLFEKSKSPKAVAYFMPFKETGSGKVDRKETKRLYLKNLLSNL